MNSIKNLLELFSIPVKIVILDSLTQNNITDIIHSIDQEKLENNALIKNGYRSKTNTFLDRKLWLKQVFQEEINKYVDSYGVIPANISYSWCNKYINNGIIVPHKHEMSIVSGVYYPRILGKSSYLKIKNPCNPFKVNEISVKSTKFNMQEFEIPLEENMLILFPSWVDHYSENQSEIKYVISFDTEIATCLG
jgi:hypothetical protein